MTNSWYFSYDDNHISWIYLHPCMSSNPCRYLDGSRSMRLQLTHILSNLYTTKSLFHGGWRQGSMKSFKYIPWQIPISNFMIVILDAQVIFLANLIHVCRWNPITSGAPNEPHQLLLHQVQLQLQLHGLPSRWCGSRSRRTREFLRVTLPTYFTLIILARTSAIKFHILH